MTKSWNILLVEDDENLAFLLGEQLREHHYDVSICGKGEKALAKFSSEKFHLCILDIVLPDIDGISLAKKIRSVDGKTPIVFLTSRNLKSDMMLGYEVGADDYITKPFDADVLLAKISAIIHRCYTDSIDENEVIEVEGYTLDARKRQLKSDKGSVKLSGTECGLMMVFLREINKPVSRETVMKEVWGKSDFFVSKSLDVYITRIRKILKEHTDLNLETIHSFGFELNS